MAIQTRASKILVALLVSTFFSGLCWAALIPMWQTPDEQAHFAQVQNVVMGKFPDGRADLPTGPTTSQDIIISEKLLETFRNRGENKFTYHPEYRLSYTETTTGTHEDELERLPLSFRREFIASEATGYPPLYYAYVALINNVFWFQGIVTRVFLSRIATVILSVGAVGIVYALARLVFKDRFLAISLAALASFTPMWRFVGSGVTSDALYNFVYPLLVFCIIKIFIGEEKYFWISFLVLCVGIMTKVQILLIVPIVIVSWIFVAIGKRNFSRRTIVAARVLLLLCFALFLVGVGNYLMKDVTFYWMKKLGLQRFSSVLFLPELSDFGYKISFVQYWKMMIKELYIQGFPWYWGVYRWLSLTLPLWIYRVIKIVILISGFGWVMAGLRGIKGKSGISRIINGKSGISRIINGKSLAVIVSSSVVYTTGLLLWNFLFWMSHGYSFGIQGRYFFPNFPEHMILLLAGLLLLAPKQYRRVVSVCAVLMMALFHWYALWFVAGSYYDTSNLSTFFLQASQYKPWFFKTPILPIIVSLGILSSAWLLISLVKYNKEKHA